MRVILETYCPEVSIVGTANNGEEGLLAIQTLQPDLVFLDIEMPVMNGFKMMENIENPNFKLVFTTAYDKYAVNAFKFSALDYLLKPIDEQEVVAVIQKISGSNSNKSEDQQRLKLMSDMMKNIQSPTRNRKIALPSGDGFHIKSLDNITHFEAEGNYTKVHFFNQKMLLVSKQIGDFDEMLKEQFFFRIHKGYVINMDFVSEYLKTDGGMIRLTDGKDLPIARRRRDEFLELLEIAFGRQK